MSLLTKEEMKIPILKPDASINNSELPPTLSPSGLSEQRQQYLFDEIRVFCDEKYQDITCPEPPTRKHSIDQSSNGTGPSTKKTKRLCSHCRHPGHILRLVKESLLALNY